MRNPLGNLDRDLYVVNADLIYAAQRSRQSSPAQNKQKYICLETNSLRSDKRRCTTVVELIENSY